MRERNRDAPDRIGRKSPCGDYSEFIAVIPMHVPLDLNAIGSVTTSFSASQQDDNLGNPILPAIHGGVIGALWSFLPRFIS